ncbi:hypothetical protein SEEM030_21883 [Salmonella enterica subsp. enterica serovar Montevideo str. SARB30]|nr:hypothetical protein SEEM0047_21398 [Salmonella enterica subsp. enterica serovar Montevideo str. MB102109-0047]EHL50335.1 hypothetical protein SEEM030_21883 [Salmonella enterica subsp. enterica serovar Montevideo str. SARB30]
MDNIMNKFNSVLLALVFCYISHNIFFICNGH